MLAIVANPNDLHTHAVAWACSKVGVAYQVVYPNLVCASRQHWGMSLKDGQSRIALGTDVNGFSVVWNRRFPHYFSLPESEDWATRCNREQAFRSFVIDLMTELTEIIPAMNPVRANEFARNKMSQARIALELGFKVSNTRHGTIGDVANLRGLVIGCEGAVYKPVKPAIWPTENGNGAGAQTTKLTSDDWGLIAEMPANKELPAIYQSMIAKDCEYRVTVIGEDTFVMCQKPIENYPWADWRTAGNSAFEYTRATLPSDIMTKIREMMKRFGLMYGAFDIVRSSDGDLVFLEVNPAGQFLFCEERVPSLHILSSVIRNLCLLGKIDLSRRQQHRLEHDISFRAFKDECPSGVFLDESLIPGFGENNLYMIETHRLSSVWDKFHA